MIVVAAVLGAFIAVAAIGALAVVVGHVLETFDEDDEPWA